MTCTTSSNWFEFKAPTTQLACPFMYKLFMQLVPSTRFNFNQSKSYLNLTLQLLTTVPLHKHYKDLVLCVSYMCDLLQALRGTRWFVLKNICCNEKHILKYSDLIAVKARDFFDEISPQTFVTRGLINFCCFQMDKYAV